MLNHKILNHFNIYLFGLVLLAISLPLSLFLMSFSVFLLLFNWLIEGNFANKWKSLKARPGVIIFLGVILVHVVWLINSIDLDYGFNDIKIKLPLLVLPLILGTTTRIKQHQLKIIIFFFILSVLIGTIISSGVLFGIGNIEIHDIREISIFIHHVRFGVLVVLAIFLLLNELIYFPKKNEFFFNLIKWISLLWLILFLFILKSITGLALLFIIGFLFGFSLFFQKHKLNYRNVVKIAWLLTFIFLTVTFIRYYVRYSFVEEVDLSNLESTTTNGNFYKHNLENPQLENGNYVWIYVCEEELKKEWQKRSQLDYEGLDYKNQELRYTIIRYLSSRGVRKDSAGLASIKPEEIEWIENGIANYIYVNQTSMYPLVYNIFWQLDSRERGDNPTGHSVIQRMEHLNAGIQIFKKNFWFGIGTGDVKLAFGQYYEEVNSQLSMEVRHRAHNQFLTFLIAFGLIGFLLATLSLVLPIYFERGFGNPYFIIFITVAFLSFMVEDVLETSAGSMFFAYFYSLFLFAYQNISELESK